MKGLPHLKENRINLKKKSTTFRGFGTERARLSTFRGFGTERARLGTFRGFGTERARLGTFRGFGTDLGDPPPPRNRILNLWNNSGCGGAAVRASGCKALGREFETSSCQNFMGNFPYFSREGEWNNRPYY